MKEKILKLMLYIISLPFFLYAQDIPGSKDHPIISRYPGSYIYYYDQKEFDEFEILFGPVKIYQGEDYVKRAKKEKIEGKVTKIGYEAPKNRSVFEVFKNYEEALKKANFNILYIANGKDLSISDFLSPYFPLRPGWSESKSFYLSAKDKTGNVIISVCVMPGWGGPVILLGIVEKKEMETGLITAKDIYEKLKTEGHIAIYGIYFDFDKADIKPESEPTLKEIARFLRENPEIKVYIVGHTDNVGKLDYNMELSRKRAENVVKELINKYGISKERLKAFGVGPLAPISSNDTEEGRAKNRRVEIVKE
ncbi:MAG: DUF4892 domain-containing protein [candidate division WOR-3 bacterium]